MACRAPVLPGGPAGCLLPAWGSDGPSQLLGHPGLGLSFGRWWLQPIPLASTLAHGVWCCARCPARPEETDWLWGGLDCPEGRWGLGCQEICPVCEHGAACEPETGACRCRPGYTGSRCEDGECQTADLSPCPGAAVPAPAHPPCTCSVPRRLVRARLPHALLLCQRWALRPGNRTLQLCPWVDRPQLPER